ncbi:MAG: methyltransferase domain-containing protein, partial [Candidatus Eiseniibacteriota bacterium]
MTEPRCPACHATGLTDFFAVERLPVDVGRLPATREEALRAPRGDVILAGCHVCGFVFNRIYDPGLVVFEPGYEAYLNHSQVFRAFLEEVAARLVERFDLRGRTILEIGCGSGYFLELLCRRGANRGIGIDPSLREERDVRVGDGSLRLVRDHYADRHLACEPDFICCQSVFEDLPEPLAFLSGLRRALGARTPPVYFEVFNALRAFRQRESWSVNYEQCNYWGLDSLAGVFRRSGFTVLEAAECYEEGQYIYVDAVPAPVAGPPADGPERRATLPPEIAEFGTHHRGAMRRWQAELAEMGPDRRRTVA